MKKGYILEQGEQGVSVASKSLLDENYDRFFTVSAENFHTIVVCSVHAIYLSWTISLIDVIISTLTIKYILYVQT